MRHCHRTGALLVALAGLALTAAPSRAAAPDAAQTLNDTDRAFLTYAAEDNQAEIDLCLLAEKKAASAAVKAFARLMVDDHVQIESRLASLSHSVNTPLPDGPGKEGAETKAKLMPLEGAAFDAKFMAAQIEDHGSDLKKFDAEAKSTQTAGLRQYAAETSPLLEQHLELAKVIKASLPASQASGK